MSVEPPAEARTRKSAGSAADRLACLQALKGSMSPGAEAALLSSLSLPPTGPAPWRIPAAVWPQEGDLQSLAMSKTSSL